MRFHCGFSFSWHSIKRFLIPFLIGFLTFFGFNYLKDNKVVPLGVIQTYALEEDSPGESPDYSNYEFVYETDNVEHKPLHDKIYWFDNNTTLNGILSSIYILLFLYCLSMILLRILTIIKNTRW